MKILIFALALGLIAGVTAARQPPARAGQPRAGARGLEEEMNRKFGRGEGTLKPGDRAPDFDLQALKSTARVRLSSFTSQKPVALIFGSYT